MKCLARIWLVLLVALFVGFTSFAYAAPSTTKNNTKANAPKASSSKEKINNLKKQQSDVKRNVEQIDQKLSDNKKSVKKTLGQIEQLNEDIRQRNMLIDSQNVEINKLDEDIRLLNDELLKMEMQYNVQKRKYVEMVYLAYQKNSVYDRLMFLFSASTLQQSYARFQYIREFAKMRRRQAAEIQDTRTDLLAKRVELETAKARSQKLLTNRELEKQKVVKEKQEQNALVTSLRKEEKELRKQLEKEKAVADKLNRRIQELVSLEAERAIKQRSNVASKGSKTPTKAVAGKGTAPAATKKTEQQPAKVSTDPESRDFEVQKGRLHWPVRRGSITGHFGVQRHPVLSNATINNKGVYITSPAGIEALAASKGKVTQIFAIPGSNNAVIVRHGSYLTVYANLTSIYVTVGQDVLQGDKLGRVYTDPDDTSKSVLFFQIWREKELQNPENWLRPLK